jgi:hypothetical protein
MGDWLNMNSNNSYTKRGTRRRITGRRDPDFYIYFPRGWGKHERRKFCDDRGFYNDGSLAWLHLTEEERAASISRGLEKYWHALSPAEFNLRSAALADGGRKNAERYSKEYSGVEKVHPLIAKGPLHFKSLTAVVRDPRGVEWEIVNVNHFVRTHSDLFDPITVIWTKKLSRPGRRAVVESCLAAKGLRSILSFGSARVPKSWHGWVAVSRST